MNSETRKSQNILKGLVQNKKYVRSESVPAVVQVSNSKRNKENNYQQIYNNKCAMTLNQIGLPSDTFDEIELHSNLKNFRKSVENLNRIFPLYAEPIEIDLKKLKRTMTKQLKIFENIQHQTHQKSISGSVECDYDCDCEYDNEISNINENSTRFDSSKKFRSSSALSSKIPTPIKRALTERPLSKIEMRIQRKQSLEIYNQMSLSSNNVSSVASFQSSSPSKKGVVNFDECF